METLRKLLDPETWPKDYLVHEGEVWEFVSDDPLEECLRRALYKGALQ